MTFGTPGMGEGTLVERHEQGERLHTEPAPVTIYLLRHGLTGKDKSNPNRELTEVGREQVTAAIRDVVDQLIREVDPHAKITDDNRAVLFAPVAEQIQFQLYDSGTTRTQEQVTLEQVALKQWGAGDESIYVPASVQRYQGEHPTAGPGVAKRLEGVMGLDENPGFRKQLDDPATQERLGSEGALLTWLLMPEEEIPGDVENPSQMKGRMQATVNKVRRVIPYLAREAVRTGQRRVIIGNSHGSFSTLSASEMLGVDLRTIGQVHEAEGIRLRFNADGSSRSVEPFGEKIEARLSTEQ